MINGNAFLDKATNIVYERIPKNDIPLLILDIKGTQEEPLPDVEKHWHYNLEIILPLTCSLEVWANGETYIIEKDHLFIINSEIIHSIKAHDIYEFDHTLCFQISYDFLKSIYPDFDEIYFSNNFNEDINKKLIPLFLALHDAYKNKSKFKDLIVQGYLMTIIGTLLEKQSFPRKISSNTDTSKTLNDLMQVISYIDKNYYEQVNINELAKQFGFSYGYLARSFKKSFNVTIKQYITMERLEHALNNLIYTNISVTEIALNNGFPSLEAFNREFFQKYKITPLNYRKKVRK